MDWHCFQMCLKSILSIKMREYDNLHLKLKLLTFQIIFILEETPSDYEIISGGNSYFSMYFL